VQPSGDSQLGASSDVVLSSLTGARFENAPVAAARCATQTSKSVLAAASGEPPSTLAALVRFEAK
jgi:hypothetical protein